MGTVYPCLPNANPDTDPIPWTCDFHPQPHPHWQYMNKLLELATRVHGPSRLALACALRGCREALPRSSVTRAMALGDA